MIEVGTLDRITAIIGERGQGKSTLAKLDARAFQQETGGYVIGHSPNGQIGQELDIEFHDSPEKLARGLRRRPAKMHFVAAGPAEPLFRYVESLSLGIRERAWRRRHPMSLRGFNRFRPLDPGTMAPPILLIIDEGVAMKRNPSNDETQRLELFLTSARHCHVAFTWLVQAPTSRQWIIMEQANRFRVFRYVHEWGGNSLRAAGISQGSVEDIRQAPRFVYWQHDKMSPEAAGWRKLPAP